jgi:hypothetical protein
MLNRAALGEELDVSLDRCGLAEPGKSPDESFGIDAARLGHGAHRLSPVADRRMRGLENRAKPDLIG